jgi:hypothetical protein
MKLSSLLKKATDKGYFVNIQGYVDFCSDYLTFISNNLQAIIVSQNENQYRFYQYGKNANYQITRPINSNLMYDFESFEKVKTQLPRILRNAKDISERDAKSRALINNSIYTIQQSIGAALDALPAGKSNVARKINGDLFENFIRLIIKTIGIDCKAGVVQVPVFVDGHKQFDMSYQHDLIVEEEGKIKLIGSIKTSSKDRIDKIFIDKFLYSKLTETVVPHIAVFLNDVQRKNTAKKNEYGINATFLPGHFKGYTVKLNPLDGVYYCDIRPNMLTEAILKDHIKTFDHLVCTDIWSFL